jgi:hypothetical protein
MLQTWCRAVPHQLVEISDKKRIRMGETTWLSEKLLIAQRDYTQLPSSGCSFTPPPAGTDVAEL